MAVFKIRFALQSVVQSMPPVVRMNRVLPLGSFYHLFYKPCHGVPNFVPRNLEGGVNVSARI